MYCDRRDLIDRLSEAGVLYIADDDSTGGASSGELEASLDRAIAAASAEIDAALTPIARLPLDVELAWLRDRAVDLASERLAERKGGPVPTALAAAATRSRAWLEAVRAGKLRVPGLASPRDLPPGSGAGRPRVANPGDGCPPGRESPKPMRLGR